MLRIVALVIVLLIALVGYKLGMDGGQITVLIIILSGVLFGLWYLQKRYGAKKVFGSVVNGMLNVYDPTLPSLTSDLDTQHPGYQGPYSDHYETDAPYSPPSTPPYSSGEPSTNPPQRAYMAQQQGRVGSTYIQEVRGPDIQGSLNAGTPGHTRMPALPMQPAYAPLAPINQYEMYLGPNAFIDTKQAFINACLLDPTGNVVRVLAEELATKGVPLLFIDVNGAYKSLLGEFPLGWRIVSPASQEGPVDPRAIPLDRDSKEEAQHVGHTILQEGWQVLFEFSSYASPIDAVVTLWDLVQGMGEWERTQQRRSGRLLPCVIFITEAYRFCPDANKHSIFREIPDVAHAVRGNIVQALKAGGQDGLYWYLATRKVTGMEQQALRQCALWMIHRPSVPEVQSGWITAYTGVDPQDLQGIPAAQTMILDVATRAPQLITFRESRSQSSTQNTATFTLHTIPQLPSTSPLPEDTLPFQNR